jgi:hypothetical protein
LIQTLRRFQTETQSLKEKISSKNDIIRQQEKMVQEQKERLNDLNRKNLSLEETIGLLNQKRALLEREFNESKKQIQESVKVIQDNEKVHVPSLLSILSSPDSLSLRSSLISTRCSQTFNWEVLGLGGACLLLALADTPPPCIAPPGAGEGMEPLWWLPTMAMTVFIIAMTVTVTLYESTTMRNTLLPLLLTALAIVTMLISPQLSHIPLLPLTSLAPLLPQCRTATALHPLLLTRLRVRLRGKEREVTWLGTTCSVRREVLVMAREMQSLIFYWLPTTQLFPTNTGVSQKEEEEEEALLKAIMMDCWTSLWWHLPLLPPLAPLEWLPPGTRDPQEALARSRYTLGLCLASGERMTLELLPQLPLPPELSSSSLVSSTPISLC